MYVFVIVIIRAWCGAECKTVPDLMYDFNTKVMRNVKLAGTIKKIHSFIPTDCKCVHNV